jgi:hypothetical protein
VRAFVRLREIIASNKELARRLDELEARIERKLCTHGQAIAGILDAIRALSIDCYLPDDFMFQLDADYCGSPACTLTRNLR